MLIHSASQLLTVSGPPQRGNLLGNLGIIEDGAVLIRRGVIEKVGSSEELLSQFGNEEQIDAAGKVVMPGFVDPHSHAVWAGDRALEFEMKLEGKTYLEILESGGGILSTVRDTRKATKAELIHQTEARLKEMIRHGSTTIEVKTGYGLELETEIKMLETLLELDQKGPWDLVITFLGAHAVPPEYEGKSDEYSQLISQEMLPAVRNWWNQRAPNLSLPFADVFCETGAFDLAQSEMILNSAKALGFPLKIHADEFDNLGGTRMAAELGSTSADHLVAVSDQDIEALGNTDTVAVVLPGTPFGLAHTKYAPVKKIIEAGGILALASDLNPGTSWCENIQMALAIACRYMQLTPAQAVAAATINAAAALNLEDKIGSIEEGKQGDIIILSVPDYRHLGYRYGINLVETVIKDGLVLDV